MKIKAFPCSLKKIFFLLYTPKRHIHTWFRELIFPLGPTRTAFLWQHSPREPEDLWFKTSQPSQVPQKMRPSTSLASLAVKWEGRARTELKASQAGCCLQHLSTCVSKEAEAGHTRWISFAPRIVGDLCLKKMIKLLPALSDKRHSRLAVCLLPILAQCWNEGSLVLGRCFYGYRNG